MTDAFGVNFPDGGVSLATLTGLFTDALRDKSQSAWVIGDCLLYAQEHGLEDSFAEVLDARSISLRTAQNAASVCKAWPKRARKIPVSQSHYAACASLAGKQLKQALDVLREAWEGGLDRDWVRQRVRDLSGQGGLEADVLLVYDRERGVFVPSFVPDWLASGYSRQITVRG